MKAAASTTMAVSTAGVPASPPKVAMGGGQQHQEEAEEAEEAEEEEAQGWGGRSMRR
jgi:ribosomal protein L12E/L44/L45/RPP1/RPP2